MKYIEYYEKIRHEITKGDYRYGEKLPSKRDAAANEAVSLITVQHAYELLCDEGYIESRERSGYFVIYKKRDFIGENDKQEVTVEINDSNVSHDKGDFSFNILAKTMRKVIADYGDKILERTPNKGCIELRSAIVTHLSETREMNIDINQIVIGSGAEYLYGLIAQLFPRDVKIAVEEPGYSKIAKVYEAMGHETERLKLVKDGILSTELKATTAQILHVTPFHSFPSGVTASISKKHEYLDWAKEGRVIVEDNYDSELTVSRKLEDALFSLATEENVIYINTFTKTIAPSIRVGYMILPKGLMKRFDQKLGFYACTVPSFEQLVLAELLRSGEYRKQVNKMRRRIRSGLEKKLENC